MEDSWYVNSFLPWVTSWLLWRCWLMVRHGPYLHVSSSKVAEFSQLYPFSPGPANRGTDHLKGCAFSSLQQWCCYLTWPATIRKNQEVWTGRILWYHCDEISPPQIVLVIHANRIDNLEKGPRLNKVHFVGMKEMVLCISLKPVCLALFPMRHSHLYLQWSGHPGFLPSQCPLVIHLQCSLSSCWTIRIEKSFLEKWEKFRIYRLRGLNICLSWFFSPTYKNKHWNGCEMTSAYPPVIPLNAIPCKT